MATRKTKKKRSLKQGQRVKYKNQKSNMHGIVWSVGPAKIGDSNKCKIPGGPLTLEGYVYIQWIINGEKCICIESVDELEIFKRT